MRRLVFNVLALMSLLICVATCVLWVRSYRLMESLTWEGPNGYRLFATARGHLELHLFLTMGGYRPAGKHWPKYRRDEPIAPGNYLILLDLNLGPYARDINWERSGFAWYERRDGRTREDYIIAVAPFWALALVTGVVPASWIAARVRSTIRQRREKATGHCRNCGYDLRATPHRCPECGTDPTSLSLSGSR